MDNQPLISVIIPCYNMERFITHTIESVMNQTYPCWELLIVDDASTDRTAEKIQQYCLQDPRIKLTVKDHHAGIADARNEAIQLAHGVFLAFLDADDTWHPDKLQRQLQFMLEHKAGLSYTSYDLMDEDGHPLEKTIQATHDLNYKDYLRNTIIGCSTVMVNTSLVGEVTVPRFRTSEDAATWLSIMKKGILAYALHEPLTSYRIRRKSASSNKLKAAADLWKVYRQQEKLPLLKAIYFFLCYVFNAIKKRLF